MKPRWFLKIFWENFVVNNFQFFLRTNCKRVKDQHLHVQIVGMSYFYNSVFILAYCVITPIPSRTRWTRHERGQSPTLSLAAVWLCISCRLAFHNNNQGHLTTAFCKISVGKSKYCLEFSTAWERLRNSRWPFHSCTIFEAYLINSLRFSDVWFFIFHSPRKGYFSQKKET